MFVEIFRSLFFKFQLNYSLKKNFFFWWKNLNSNERKIAFTEEFYSNENYWRIDDNDLQNLIKKTNGLHYGEIRTFIDFIKQEHAISNFESFKKTYETALHKFEHNRKFKQENRLNIESVNWNDIGGLGDIKEIIMDTILLPLNYPNLFTSSKDRLGISRSGILLYGPPGTVSWKFKKKF